jgi:hypothetical protein
LNQQDSNFENTNDVHDRTTDDNLPHQNNAYLRATTDDIFPRQNNDHNNNKSLLKKNNHHYNYINNIINSSNNNNNHNNIHCSNNNTINTANVCLANDNNNFKQHEVMIDNCASISIFMPSDLLQNHRVADTTYSIAGISGSQHITVSIIADLMYLDQLIATVYVSKKSKANILSWNSIKNNFNIKWDQLKNEFHLNIINKTFKFVQRRDLQGLYVCNMKELIKKKFTLITTLETNLSKYTKREVDGARLAREAGERLGLISDKDLLFAINHNTIKNIPFNTDDVIRAYDIFGKSIPTMAGKTKRSTSDQTKFETSIYKTSKDLVMSCDVVIVQGLPFFISITEPLQLSIVSNMNNDYSTTSIEECLNQHIKKYTSRNFKIIEIISDNEGGVRNLVSKINEKGIIIEQKAKASHAMVIERFNQLLKERIRGILALLPYILPDCMLYYLIVFANQKLNQFARSTATTNVSPHELFYAKKLDWLKHFKHSFGELVYTHEESTSQHNSMMPRIVPALALISTGSTEGTVMFMNIQTFKIIVRNNWDPSPITKNIIRLINEKAQGNKSKISKLIMKVNNVEVVSDDDEEENNEISTIQELTREEITVELNNEESIPIPNNYVEDTSIEPMNDVTNKNVIDNSVPIEIIIKKTDHIDSETPYTPHIIIEDTPLEHINDSTNKNVSDNSVLNKTIIQDNIFPPFDKGEKKRRKDAKVTQDFVNDEQEIQQNFKNKREGKVTPAYQAYIDSNCKKKNVMFASRHKNMRLRRKINHTEFIVLNISVTKALKTMEKPALQSIIQELNNIVDKDTFQAIHRKDLNENQIKNIIRSSMFLKMKFDPQGLFEKLKARLVAGGNMQDRSIYQQDDIGAPTASITSIFTIATIAAKEERHVVTVDIASAYLNASIGDEDVFMYLDELQSKILCMIDNSYQDYINKNGTMIVKLKKALYGCIQSAMRWYKHLSTTLKELGFTKNPTDPCIFNMNGKEQCTIIIYVDDLMITCKDKSTIDDVLEVLLTTYKDLSIHEGVQHDYLGCHYDFSIKGQVNITMEAYIKDCIDQYGITNTSPTPAKEDILDITHGVILDEDRRQNFHSAVYKLLYLSKRVRPEIQFAVSFLCTRVQIATDHDETKLLRVLQYLKSEPTLGLTLEMNEDVKINAFVDASYACHSDGKGHTGSNVTLGRGSILAECNKQKINTKSSTESELVGLSDASSSILFVRYFIIHQGYVVGPAIIGQDNNSCITLAEKGRSTCKNTKHIDNKYFWINDRINSNEIVLEEVRTNLMVADILTKPLNGAQFIFLRNILLGITISPK